MHNLIHVLLIQAVNVLILLRVVELAAHQVPNLHEARISAELPGCRVQPRLRRPKRSLVLVPSHVKLVVQLTPVALVNHEAHRAGVISSVLVVNVASGTDALTRLPSFQRSFEFRLRWEQLAT